MTETDKKICRAKVFDTTALIFLSLLLARFSRKILFKIDSSQLDILLKNSAFSTRWIKTVLAYSVVGSLTYNYTKDALCETYLADLALEYR